MPMVDQTGLHGVSNFDLTWTPANRPDESIDPPGVSLFDALQEQLGLKLDQRKAPVDRIVIHHIERLPSENCTIDTGLLSWSRVEYCRPLWVEF
jgi:uncharacterized protein (TIGR03435 family)